MIKSKAFNHDKTVGEETWFTPKYVVDALGHFDLDPCSHINRPWPTAKQHLTKECDGFRAFWLGRVWMNPPYGKETKNWMDKLAKYGNGIALIYARTETKMFFNSVWDRADGLLFIKGRLRFYDINGNLAKSSAGAPSVLVAYGQDNYNVLENCALEGKRIRLK